jgi:hypothetical protein
MPLTEKGVEIKRALVKEYGAEKGERVLYAGKNKGTFTGIDSMAKDEVAMTASEVQKKNEDFWGNIGPAPSEESAPMLAGTKVGPSSIKVWHGAGVGDEVSPTQSAPADPRSDNLLERGHGGIPGTESLTGGSVPNPLEGTGDKADAVPGQVTGQHMVKYTHQGQNKQFVVHGRSSQEATASARQLIKNQHPTGETKLISIKPHTGDDGRDPGSQGIAAAKRDTHVAKQREKGVPHETIRKNLGMEKSEYQKTYGKDELVEGSEAQNLSEHQTDLGIGEAVRTGRQIGEKVARGEMPIGVDAKP